MSSKNNISQWKNKSYLLGQIGRKKMQLALSEPPRTLSRSELQNLKRRFKAAFRPDEIIEAIGSKRCAMLKPLIRAFSHDQRRTLLVLLVPNDYKAKMIKQEDWKKISARIVLEHFLDRFEGIKVDKLQAYLMGETTVVNGLVQSEDFLKASREDVKETMKKLDSDLKDINTRLRLGYKFKVDMVNKRDKESTEILDTILSDLGNKATKHFHDGDSTYAEPSGMYMKTISDAITTELNETDIVLDLGSGAGTTLWCICQQKQCRGIGIEYGKRRLFSAAGAILSLFKKHSKNPRFNSQVVNTYGDIMDLAELPPCTVLYMYDEAFPGPLMHKIFGLINKASPKLKCVISYKGYRNGAWRGALEDSCNGIRLISHHTIKKRFSQEGSHFGVYERRVHCSSQSRSGSDSSKYTDYWQGSISQKIDFYRNLKAQMSRETSRMNRSEN